MKTKKAFKDRVIGKILLSPPVKGALSLLPFNVGAVANEMLSQTDTPEGEMNREKLLYHIFKFIIYGVLIYLVFSGRIDFDQAEQAKEFISE